MIDLTHPSILQPDFYQLDTITLAQRLIGTILIHQSKDGITAGMVVETEAYVGSADPAAHSYGGQTERNKVLFGPPGRAYIYFTYGMHYCFNVSTSVEGSGEGVLIRALRPVEGIQLMQQRRGMTDQLLLCQGPARLVQAMGITQNQNGHDLTELPLYLAEGQLIPADQIGRSGRIGISKAADLLLRFYLLDSPFVSHQPRLS